MLNDRMNENNGDRGCARETVLEAAINGRRPGAALQTPIEDLELSIRPYSCLKRAGVDTVEKLCAMSEEDLMKVRNLGRKSIIEIRERLAALSGQEKEAALTAGGHKVMPDGSGRP